MAKYIKLISFILFTILFQLSAQGKASNLWDDDNFIGLKFRSIGPAFMSGRISDIAIHPEDENTWYLAVGSGNVWKTVNSGVTWDPIFDDQGSYSIGCVTIDPNNPHVVWVGTGEDLGGRHFGYGDGIYRSEDGGKNWTNMGLKNSEHIGNIVVHPKNSDIIYVSAYGPLWKKGGDRGLYKSVDGGKNWNRILYVDEHTGINEIHMDPKNPNVLYAASHQRRRHVYTYVGGGPGSGLYKSADAGKSWKKINKGLPSVELGRIGLDISPVDNNAVSYTHLTMPTKA